MSAGGDEAERLRSWLRFIGMISEPPDFGQEDQFPPEMIEATDRINNAARSAINGEPAPEMRDQHPRPTEPFAMPDRIAIDANGYGWRVWDGEDLWSMVPVNPDNSPIPQPVTWFVPAEIAPSDPGVTVR